MMLKSLAAAAFISAVGVSATYAQPIKNHPTLQVVSYGPTWHVENTYTGYDLMLFRMQGQDYAMPTDNMDKVVAPLGATLVTFKATLPDYGPFPKRDFNKYPILYGTWQDIAKTTNFIENNKPLSTRFGSAFQPASYGLKSIRNGAGEELFVPESEAKPTSYILCAAPAANTLAMCENVFAYKGGLFSLKYSKEYLADWKKTQLGIVFFLQRMVTARAQHEDYRAGKIQHVRANKPVGNLLPPPNPTR